MATYDVSSQESSNEYRHKGSDSLYAHYSQIDEYDLTKYPDLSFANPMHFTLQPGQSLYIPRNWWHWVKTTKKTFAVNFWFNNSVEQSPFVFNHSIEYDLTKLDDETVVVWNSGKEVPRDQKIEVSTFKEFYNSGLEDRCVITLENYPTGKPNRFIKSKLADYVCFPSDPDLVPANKPDYNLWITSNKHDTGLHYDDEDGILTVVEGEKEIILFPPSDSVHLCPYKVEHKWRKNPALNFRYNTYRNLGEVPGVSSSELLYVTCNEDKRVLSNISKLYELALKHQFTLPLIWGFKKDVDSYRWEVYRPSLTETTRITSWDIYPNQNDISEVEHYYYKFDDGPPTLPFWGYGKQKKNNVLCDESKIYVVDSYSSFYGRYDEYMDRLGFGSVKNNLRDLILKRYSCHDMCIHNKKPNEIFVQYLGLTNEEFVEFLTENKYPSHLTQFVTEQVRLGNYRINNEVTVVYNTNTQQIVRSGFYGTL